MYTQVLFYGRSRIAYPENLLSTIVQIPNLEPATPPEFIAPTVGLNSYLLIILERPFLAYQTSLATSFGGYLARHHLEQW